MRRCKGCGQEKELREFPSVKRGSKTYKRWKCNKCEAVRVKNYRATSPTYEARMKKWLAKRRAQRANGTNVAAFILWDARKMDRRKGRDNDLTKPFIEEMISKPCSYCQERELRMTLDRIDNDLGHLQTNVVPACVRCNYARRDMPYEAWLCLVPGLRRARNKGAFGIWTGQTRQAAMLELVDRLR